jgi:hypothetical protein
MKKSILFKRALIAAVSFLSINSFATTDGEEAVLSASAPTVRYSTRMIDRPGIMPTEMFGVDVNFSRSSTKKYGVDIAAEVGIVDHLQAMLSYGGVDTTDFKAFEPKKAVTLGLKYNYFSMPNFSTSIDAKLPINFSGDIVKEFTVGLPTTFYNDVMAGSLFGDLFTLKVRPNVAFDVDFKWWYGYQVYGDFWAQLNSSFGKVAMKNPNNQATWENEVFWKVLPLRVTGVSALNNYFDVSANAGFDNVLDKASDNFFIGVGFTARGGSIFG